MKSIEVKKLGAKKAPPVMPKRLKTSPQRPVVKKQMVLQQKASILKRSVQDTRVASPVREKTRPLKDSNLNGTNIFNGDGMNFSNLDNLFVPNQLNKENKSPVTPPNIGGLYKDIKFTPHTYTIPKESSNLEYLASLPTPKGDTYNENRHQASPERVRFYLPEMSIMKLTTPSIINASDISVMAQMPTPTGLYNEMAHKTVTMKAETPARANTTNFAPHIFSTLTKMAMKVENEDSLGGKELFFDALEDTFGTPRPLSSLERLSTETYVQVDNGERFSSETYVKCQSSMMGHEELVVHPVMDKTRVITPPPPLSMIEEESEVDTTSHVHGGGLQSKTFNMNDVHNKTPPNLHKKAVEQVSSRNVFANEITNVVLFHSW